jgi:hypothetical protein
MTHLIARDYKPEDFSETEFSPHEQCVIVGQPIGEWARLHGNMGPAYTVVDPGGAVVFCAGVHHFWHGTGELWGLFSPLAKTYLETPAFAKQLLEVGVARFGYERLQAVVNPEWTEAVRFIKLLEFKKEVDMKKYGPNGVDMTLYAWVKGD